MAGDEEESWKVQFENAGFSVECILKGLGEYPKIRALFIDHIKDAIASAS
jgi:cobalamin biosynthesis Co2+ chelatase CbiK